MADRVLGVSRSVISDDDCCIPGQSHEFVVTGGDEGATTPQPFRCATGPRSPETCRA